MDKINIKNCTGCGACANICPHSAITITEDERGFLKPLINKNKCINCGLCENVCPVLNFETVNSSSPKFYAFINQDETVRLKSASGGVFPAFAKYFIKNGGVVFGVVYDEDMKVCHIAAQTLSEIEKMQSSKYVQSDTKFTFKEAKKMLESGLHVLYTGTPCQIAGLKSYLRKDYENLLTMDIICHGVPSRKFFEMYKEEFLKSQKDKGKLININMRAKDNGWNSKIFLRIKTTEKDYFLDRKNNSFMKCFLGNLSINDSCVDCKFNKIPRTADITMGDFWGVDEFDATLNDSKGTSIILINSKKGEKYFNKILKNAEIITREVPQESATKHNPNIIKSSIAHPKREEFLKDIETGKKTPSALTKKYLHKKIYIKFLKFLYNHTPAIIKCPVDKYILKKL